MEAPPEFRLAIVGCGAAARQCHVPGLTHTRGIVLSALVDPVPANAHGLAAEFQRLSGERSPIEVATSLDDLVTPVDGAVIAAPHREHAGLARQCFELGIHCLVEKPMALTVEDCGSMIDRADDAGLTLGVAFVRRLFPASVWVRKLIAEGALGQVTSLVWREGAPYDWPLVTPSLFLRTQAGGGVLADGGSHVLDLITWLLDGEGRITSMRDSAMGGVESDALVEMRVGEVAVSIELSRTRLLANSCTITGTAGSVEFGIDVESVVSLSDVDGRLIRREISPVLTPAQADWELLFTEQLRNFAAAARGQEPIYADGRAGLEVTRLISGSYGLRRPFHFPWREVTHGAA